MIIILKKKCSFCRAVTGSPNEIVKPYNSRVAADKILDMSPFAAKFAQYMSRKTVTRQTHDDRPIYHVKTPCGPAGLPYEGRTAAARSLQNNIMSFLFLKEALPPL